MSQHEVINQVSTSQTTERRRLSPHIARLTGYIAGVALVFGLAAIGLLLATFVIGKPVEVTKNLPQSEAATPVVPLNLQRPIVDEAGLMERSGVRVVYVAVTGDGGLVDLRYQVIDPDKAAAVHDEDAYPPTIIDESSGLVVDNLLMGHLHHGDLNPGQTYYLIFENPGNLVQPGSKVSVLLGDAELDQVVVK